MHWAQAVRELATIRDVSAGPARRAFAAATLAADDEPARSEVAADPSMRMFGFDTRHDDATPWDGRGMRSGTVTYLDDERVEQYVGQQKWIAYRRADLNDFGVELGDQLKIAQRGNAVFCEAVGPNRLKSSSSAPVREVSSGMVLVRTHEASGDEIASLAGAVAERYGALTRSSDAAIVLDFGSAAQLAVVPLGFAEYAEFGESALLGEPVAAAFRLTVTVRSNKLDAALEAERALVLFAAMLASNGEAIAVDDSGAIFSADQLYSLGTRNEMRADAFGFTAAAARRQWPVPQRWFSGRGGVCDELTVFSIRPWRADFAASFLQQQLGGLADAARYNDDPVIPPDQDVFDADERGEAGSLQRLATLSYATVDIDVSFVDVSSADADMRDLVESRKAIEGVLGRPIASAIVIAYGNRDDDTASAQFELEMRRAETLATVLAAAFAERGDSAGADVAGALYAASELRELALRRCGKSASWNARVAAFTP